MLGTSIREAWVEHRPDDELVAVDRSVVDLRDRGAVAELLRQSRPDAVIHAAALVGGVAAKQAHPTAFLLDNVLIDSSVISAALETGVTELLYLSSAAVYPEHHEMPLREDALLDGRPDEVNEGYAIAKIAGTRLCAYISREHGLAYRAAVPSNLYGPHDDFSVGNGHLVAAALAKVHEARRTGSPSVEVWGDGTARREFTFSEDLAAWLVTQPGRLAAWPALLNLGTGIDHTIAEYYRLAAQIVGYDGELEFHPELPSGAQRRLLDSGAAHALGWAPATDLTSGMTASYRAYLSTRTESRTS